MALRAGYYGLKKKFIDKVNKWDQTVFLRSEQAVLGAKNIWDESIALSPNASATVTKTTDGYAVQTNTTANSGGQFNQTQLRTRYTPFGNITVSFEYKSDIACAGYIGKSDVTLATDWTKVSYSVDGSTMGAICFYNRDTTKTPLIEMRNMMITLATDTDLSFVPTAMTNKELTEKVTINSSQITLSSNVTANNNSVNKQGNVVDLYLYITSMPDTASGDVIIGITPFKPIDDYLFFTVYSTDAPFQPIAGGFIRSNNGEIVIKSGAMNTKTSCYIQCTYICQ